LDGFTGPVVFVELESPFALAVSLFGIPPGSLGALLHAGLSVISDEPLFAVASSSVGESLVGSTVGKTNVAVLLEAEVTDAVVLGNFPVAVFWTFLTVDSVELGEALDAVAASSWGESLVLSTVRDALVVFHLEGEVADAGSLSVVGADIPVAVGGALFTVHSVVSGEAEFAVASSSLEFSGVLSTIVMFFVGLGLGRWLVGSRGWGPDGWLVGSRGWGPDGGLVGSRGWGPDGGLVGSRGWGADGWFDDFSTDIIFGVVDVALLASASVVLAAVPGILGASGAVSQESDIALLALAVVADEFLVSSARGSTFFLVVAGDYWSSSGYSDEGDQGNGCCVFH
jgi:hypothetical protein